MKKYTWTVTMHVTVDFNKMLNRYKTIYQRKPETIEDYEDEVDDYISRFDDAEYYNITDEIREQIKKDFIKYCEEK